MPYERFPPGADGLHIAHVALGGCLTAPPIRFGITGDTGGHIAYLLGAALAQSRRPGVDRVDLVTRAFDDPRLGPAHARPVEPLDDVVRIRRIAGGGTAYLEKEALEAALPEVTESYLDLLGSGPRPDVIHAHFADAAQLALAARERYGIPVVYTPHSLALGKRDCGLDSPGLSRRIARERRAIAEADAIVVSSRDEAEKQIEGYGMAAAGRTHRIDPGVHMAAEEGGTARARALVDPLLAQPALPMLLAIARPVAKKNLAALVEAYATTPGLRDAANLVILAGQASDATGDAVRETLHALAAKHRLEGRIALPPCHEGRDVPQLYRLARARRGIFVNAALHEPFGLTLIEAAQAGLPVVATAEGGPADILETIGHGTCVDPTDIAAIGAACARLITDGAAWEACARAARRGHGAYSWDLHAARALPLYRRLAEGRDAAPMRLPRGRRPLVVCDIDGTLTGDRAAAARFRDWTEAGHAPWAVATGRSIPEARRVLARWGLQEPRTIIASVGSEVWHADAAGRAEMDVAFAAAIARGWDAEAVSEALARAGARPQGRVEQRAFKRSYLGCAAEAARLEAVLRAAGLAARVIPSHGRLIDVLPARAGKAAAMRHVAGLMGLTAADCVACGDSGNDADMLAAAGRAVLPANALAELDALRGGHAIRTRAAHAAGVLEGLASLGLVPRARAAVQAEARP